jgi:hypothetical protein
MPQAGNAQMRLQNLTSSLKSVVIKAILCDRQTVKIPPPFSTCRELDGRRETGEGFSDRSWKSNSSRRIFLLFSLIISLGFNSLAQEQPSEYQIKAAFLFNFAKFVEWPPKAFAETNSPIVIGVLGKNVFGNELERTIRDKRVYNRPFKFKNFESAGEATNCHILFISSSEKDNFAKIIGSLQSASVLTVSDSDGFIKAGGMINFLIEDTKIRFQINDEAAKKAGLVISSKLLSLSARGH